MAPRPHPQATPSSSGQAHVSLIMKLVRNQSLSLTTGTGKQSRLRCLTNGVSQKLVLAPLLFNTYEYDLQLQLAKIFDYAADLAILHYASGW